MCYLERCPRLSRNGEVDACYVNVVKGGLEVFFDLRLVKSAMWRGLRVMGIHTTVGLVVAIGLICGCWIGDG